MIPRQVATAFVVLFLLFAVQPSPRMQTTPLLRHTVRSLGTLDGESRALAVSPLLSVGGDQRFFGAVVGSSRVASGADHAFLFFRGEMRDLGTLGGASSVATSANDAGEVVGSSTNSAGVRRAFLYFNGSMQDLGSLSAGGASDATSLNYLSEVVGAAETSPGVTRAFIYRSGAMTLLDPGLAGVSAANDINASGQVVGYSSAIGSGVRRAFLYSGGTSTTLGTLGGIDSEAIAINDAGDVVGRSRVASAAQHAFLYRDGTMRDLGTLGGAASEALAIDDKGRILGRSQIAGSSAYHAFLWRDGTMIDLNSLLPENSGWVLESATGINLDGQIVGHGRFEGQVRAFVLTPPVDVQLSVFGFEDFTSNLPRPVQAGRSVAWVYFVTVPDEFGGTATNVEFTDTLTGPVEYAGVNIHGGDGTCTIEGRQLRCRFSYISGEGWGGFVIASVRATGAGEIGHTARLTDADQADPNSSNNEFSETNTALSVTGLTLKPAVVAGGKAAGVHVTLNAPHPHGGLVRMTSSNPTVAPVPSPFIVLGDTRSFNLVPAVVSAPTTVEISATYGLVTKTATLTVLPPAVSALHLTPTTVVGGCGTVAAQVTLTGSAPSSGARVTIAETIGGAQFPTTLVVPAGVARHTFTIPTANVGDYQSGLVTASYGGVSQAVRLTVRPIRARTLVLSPNPVRGGDTATGVVTLECASPTPLAVTVTSGNGALAAPAVSTFTIPAGALSGTFAVRTSRVTAPASVAIHARVNDVRTTTILAIIP
jgi:probable HAF family extracellular repeat protein